MLIHALLTVLLVATSSSKAPEAPPEAPAPLAAPLIADGHLVVVDVPSRSVRQYPLGELAPESADMTWDKKRLVVNARPKAGGASHLYLVEADTGAFRELPIPLPSDLFAPRFADDGKTIVFSAASKPGPDSKFNRYRLHRFDLETATMRDIDTDPRRCELAPAALADGRVAYLSTSCFVDFDIRISGESKPEPTVVQKVGSIRSELATSHDGQKLVYTLPSPEGEKFFLQLATGKPKLLAVAPHETKKLQPHFICPRDVMYSAAGKVWALNSDSGDVREILDLREAAAAGTPHGPEAGHAVP